MVKQLASEHGILIRPNPKKGRAFPLEIETLVKTFYERDKISRMMQGMKDFLSVKSDDGTRSHVQKSFCYLISMSYMHNLQQNTKV